MISKKREEATFNCYGCDSLVYDITKPLVDGHCLYYDKIVRVRVTTQGIYHMQISECLLDPN